MKLKIRLSINIAVTSVLVSVAYVALIATLNKGHGLGDPMWLSFVYQVVLNALFTIIVLSFSVVPAYILVHSGRFNIKALQLIPYFIIMMVLILLYTLLTQLWFASLMPAFIGASIFYAIDRNLTKL